MKDPATFLAAAVRLAERRPAVRFMLIGAGFEPGNPAVAACHQTRQRTLSAAGFEPGDQMQNR